MHSIGEHGPAEDGTTLTDTERAIGAAHGVPVCRALGDLTHGAEVERPRQLTAAAPKHPCSSARE